MASIGLKGFLLPNHFLDGGAMGVALLLEILTDLDLSVLINGESGELVNKLDHYSFRDYEHYKHKMQHYAKLKATYLFNKNKNKTSNPIVKYLKAAYRFFSHYIIRLGILDGKIGYQISYLNAYGIILRYDFLKELRLKTSKI